MAIKGKGKTRGRRVIAAPPRPQVVVRKPPFWRRPWLWVLLGAIAAAGIGVGLFLSFRADARVERRDREIAALRTFASRLRAELPEDVQSLPGGLVVVFPTLRQDLQGFTEGTVTAEEIRQRSQEVEQAAAASADGIEAIVVESIVPGEFSQDQARLRDAKSFLVLSLRLYQDVAGIVDLAADRRGEVRQRLIERTQDVMGRAGTSFDSGFGIVAGLLADLGITTPIVPVEPVTPPAIPSPEPSPTAAASPTAEASPTAASPSP